MPSSNAGDVRQNVSLSPTTKRVIDLIAEREDRARSVVIWRAVKAYVIQHPEIADDNPAIQSLITNQ